MKPSIKTGFLVAGTLSGVFLVPALLIILHQYLYAIVSVGSFIACMFIFCYGLYTEFIGEITKAYNLEQEMFHRFNGDKQKIRFYKAFKMHFDGDLTLEQLKTWLMNHPR